MFAQHNIKTLLTRANIAFFLCCAIACIVCWHKQWSSIPITILIVAFLLDIALIDKLKNALGNKLIWPSLALFAMYAIGLLYTNSLSLGGATLERKLSFIIFPIVFAGGLAPRGKRVQYIMDAFCISCALAILFCLGNALYAYNYVSSATTVWFFYEDLARPLMHPGYLSNFYLIAIAWLGNSFLGSTNLQSSFNKKWQIVLIVLFVLFIALLTSKTAFLALCATAVIASVHALQTLTDTKTKLRIIVACVAAVAIVVVLVRIFRWQRFNAIGELKDLASNATFANSAGSRANAWLACLELIKQKPLFGYGTGMANDVLLEALKQKQLHNLVINRMHTHNQLLHTALDIGLIGLSLLGLWFWQAWRFFARHKIFFGKAMVAIAFINCCTDDMLDIQAGVVPFVFFVSLFLFGGIQLLENKEK
ncbi:MAG: hypothetical protein RL660_1335 [Bacteroidota bacterium]|jgi:O-antigen ligase